MALISPTPIIYFDAKPGDFTNYQIANSVIYNINTNLLAKSTGATSNIPYDIQVFTSYQPTYKGTSQITSNGIVFLSLAPHFGINTILIVAQSPGTMPSTSNTLVNFELPPPVNGVTTTSDVTSITIANLRSTGFRFSLSTDTTKVVLADGVLAFDAGTSEATVQRLYLGLLGRTGDAAGLGYYDAQITKGGTVAQVAAQILAGFEYTSQGTMTDPQFVRSLYEGFLNRRPVGGEGASALDQLSQGTSRAVLAASFATSAESTRFYGSKTQQVFARDADGTLVNQIYRTGLNRQADADGFATYKTYLGTGASAAALATAITGSAEFTALHVGETTNAFVGDLYRGALGREADGVGLANYAGLLNTGAASRATVTLAIATSAEAMTRLPSTL